MGVDSFSFHIDIGHSKISYFDTMYWKYGSAMEEITPN